MSAVVSYLGIVFGFGCWLRERACLFVWRMLDTSQYVNHSDKQATRDDRAI